VRKLTLCLQELFVPYATDEPLHVQNIYRYLDIAILYFAQTGRFKKNFLTTLSPASWVQSESAGNGVCSTEFLPYDVILKQRYLR
jgi:hypothetical protein